MKDMNKMKTKVVRLDPYVYQTPSVSEISIKIFLLLFIQILMLFVTKSYAALTVIFASSFGAFLAALLFYVFKKKGFHTIFSITIHGMMIGMMLPETYPAVSVFFISFFIIFLTKYFFTDCVNSWVNIICLTVVIAWFIGKKFFPAFMVTSDTVLLKNPSVSMIQAGFFPVYKFDSSITNFLNDKFFYMFQVRVPEGLLSMLWDTHSVIPAFRFNLLTILSSIILFSDGAFSTLIPSVFLGVYAVLVRLFFPLMAGGIFNTGDIVLALCTSGTLFIAVFLIQWFGTVPVTISGKVIYGLFSGVLAFLIVGCGTSPVGMSYTVVLCNIVNLGIRIFEEKKNESFVKKLVASKLSGEVSK